MRRYDKVVVGLTLCGLCASIDPERDGVKDAVLASKTAGVRVVMITGDYLQTAIAIAKNIGILITDHDVQATLNITDRAYLMFEGAILKAGTADELAADEMVRKVYLGKNFKLRRQVIN